MDVATSKLAIYWTIFNTNYAFSRHQLPMINIMFLFPSREHAKSIKIKKKKKKKAQSLFCISFVKVWIMVVVHGIRVIKKAWVGKKVGSSSISSSTLPLELSTAKMANNALTQLKKIALFCLVLIHVSVSEIIFEERFDGKYFCCSWCLLLLLLLHVSNWLSLVSEW